MVAAHPFRRPKRLADGAAIALAVLIQHQAHQLVLLVQLIEQRLASNSIVEYFSYIGPVGFVLGYLLLYSTLLFSQKSDSELLAG